MAELRVRYFAGAAAAAGVEEEALPSPATTGELTVLLGGRHPRLVAVLEVATLLVDGLATRDPSTPLGGALQVDVLPPFAGG